MAAQHKTYFIRRSARIILAFIFWLRALGLSQIVLRSKIGQSFQASPHWLIDIFKVSISEFLLITIIAFYSILASNGWWSLLFDIAYIYAFPAISLIRIVWTIARFSLSKSWKKMYPETALKIKEPTEIEAANSSPQIKFLPRTWGKFLLTKLIAPIQKFALLWCLVILINRNAFIDVVALSALIVALSRNIWTLISFLNDSTAWEEEMTVEWSRYVSEMRERLNSPGLSNAELFGQAMAFHLFILFLSLIHGVRWIKLMTRSTLLCLVLPYYAYISVLFSFVYFGLGKTYGITWEWPRYLVDSLFIPASYTDLPQNLLIRAMGGIQFVILLLIGYEAIVRGVKEKAERALNLAKRLHESEDVKTLNILIVEAQTRQRNSASPAAEATT